MDEATTVSTLSIVTPKQSNEIILDSLPYIDQIHPDYEAYALTLIEEEMEKIQPPSTSYDANKTPDFKSSKKNHSINKTEYEALVARDGQPRNEKDRVDYVKKMISAAPQDTSDQSQWEKSMERAKIEFEYERL